MRWADIRVPAAAFFTLAVCGATACSPVADGREFRDFERMRRQQRYTSYDISHYFANGAVLQPPPAHTISREALVTPMPPPGDNLVANGARQFAISCAPCHGAGGFGGGPIAPSLTEKRPVSLRTAPAASLTPQALFAVVTDGFGRMPPLGWQLSPVERWAVISYVKALASAPTTTAPERADSAMADYLHRLDSLHAVGAPIESIAVMKRPVDSPR